LTLWTLVRRTRAAKSGSFRLTLIHDGVVDRRAVWRGLHAAEDGHYIADSWLLDLLERIAAPPAPLVAVNGDRTALLTTGQNRLSLTPLGNEVLRGRRAWRWDPAHGTLRRPTGEKK
jgi:hypothetical protein